MQLYARDLMTKNFDTIHRDATVELAIRKILNAKVRPTGHKTISLMVLTTSTPWSAPSACTTCSTTCAPSPSCSRRRTPT